MYRTWLVNVTRKITIRQTSCFSTGGKSSPSAIITHTGDSHSLAPTGGGGGVMYTLKPVIVPCLICSMWSGQLRRPKTCRLVLTFSVQTARDGLTTRPAGASQNTAPPRTPFQLCPLRFLSQVDFESKRQKMAKYYFYI